MAWAGLGLITIAFTIMVLSLANMAGDVELWIKIFPVLAGLGLAFGIVFLVGRELLRGRSPWKL